MARSPKSKPRCMTPADAAVLESQRYDAAEICRLFSVDPADIGGIDATSSWKDDDGAGK